MIGRAKVYTSSEVVLLKSKARNSGLSLIDAPIDARRTTINIFDFAV